MESSNNRFNGETEADNSHKSNLKSCSGTCLKYIHRNSLLYLTLFGVIVGIFTGFAMRSRDMSEDAVLLLSYPGEIFMRLLKLLILPLIISSLVSGSASLNAKMNGLIALRTITYFVTTSFINAALGISLALSLLPSTKTTTNASRVVKNNASVLLDNLLDLGRNAIPDNLFQALFQQVHTSYKNITTGKKLLVDDGKDGPVTASPFLQQEIAREILYRNGINTLGIVFFCLAFGIVLGTLGNRGRVVVDFFSVVFEVIMRMVSIAMWLTPIGVSSVIAAKILSVQDLHVVMNQLLRFILTVVIGVLLYQWIILQMIYFAFVRRNPLKFYVGLLHPMLTAFATASTAAALPLTFRCLNEKLHIDERITRFILPIGCSINMDGTALFLAIATIFISKINGMVLGYGELFIVLVSSTAASMSSASVPSAALVLLFVVLQAVDAPAHDVTILFAVDWFVDRVRTTNNMLGDCYAAAVVEQLSRAELTALDVVSEIPLRSEDKNTMPDHSSRSQENDVILE